MKIKKIEVIVGRPGTTDRVVLHLNCTTPFPQTNDAATATVEVQKGHGIDWACENFYPQNIDVVNIATAEQYTLVRTGSTKTS